MTDDEILEVVQAHKEGKKIQIRWKDTDVSWIAMSHDPNWDFVNVDYRVAPEPRKPREWYAEIPTDGYSVGQIFTYSRQLTKGGELVRVREVIE
jgi:hypothetical protein